MAIEGDFETIPGAPLILFGLPDRRPARVEYAVEIPNLGSLILTHRSNAPLQASTPYRAQNWPPVPVIFWSFRIMVGIGLLMVGLGLLSLYARWRGRFINRAAASRSRWPWGRRASSRCWRAGSPPRSAGSPIRSMACCAPRIGLAARRAGGRLLAGRLRHRLFLVFARGPALHAAADGHAAASRRSRDRAADTRPAPPASRRPPASSPKDPVG